MRMLHCITLLYIYIYLVYLFRCIPDEERLLTGDGLEGFLSTVLLVLS